jgi:dTDP-L-rhamnose 4-epimerase
MGYRNPDAQYVEGSVLNRELVSTSLADVEAVVHLAAQVGVGQSMYEMARYVRENCLGTAVLLDAVAERRDAVASLVVASSMSIYGEGLYACETCGIEDADVVRSFDALGDRRWEPVCSRCGFEAKPMPTPERKRLECDSVYATTKRDQEELCLVFGRAYGVRTVALRFFNVYGPRQSLSNPYTGVAAIFASRLLNRAAPLVFEDGLQSRDFVHVSDIVRAIELSLDSHRAQNVVLNVGTGAATTVLGVAHALADGLGVDLAPEIVNRFRHGDIRHCYADISAAKEILGYEPEVALGDGMKNLVNWLITDAPPAEDKTQRSTAELAARGLVL